MVDNARALLDELMGRNRDLDGSDKAKKFSWDDPKFCEYFLVKVCPHELFSNTKADLGQCKKIHDKEAKRSYERAKPSRWKRKYAESFLRFCDHLLDDVNRKIRRGRERIAAISKSEGGFLYMSKFQEQLNNMNGRIRKHLQEAEEAGFRGDVDQAKDLTVLCEQLAGEREHLIRSQGNSLTANSSEVSESALFCASASFQAQDKPMEVCEVCGAFLLVGDIQQRLENHLSGRQHLGYTKLRKAIGEVREDLKQNYNKEVQEGSSKSEVRSSRDEKKHRKEDSQSKRGRHSKKSHSKSPKRKSRRDYM